MMQLGTRCQPRHTAVPLFTLRLEHNLNPELLAILIKPSPVPFFTTINITRLKLESTRLIRLCSNQEILEILVRLVNLLLKGRHEPHSRHYARGDFLVLQLKQQTQLPSHWIARLGDFVSGTTNLNHIFLHLNAHGARDNAILTRLAFFLFSRSAAGEICLVLAALGVCEIRAVVLVHGQAESAFEAADVVFEEIRILVEVDRLESEFS